MTVAVEDNGKAGAQGAFAFLRKHTHWGHYAGLFGIVISLHSLVTHLGWGVAGLLSLAAIVPAALYRFIFWKRAKRSQAEGLPPAAT